MIGDWHKICTDEYETAEAESFGALAGWCYGNNEVPPKMTEVLTDALRAAFAGAFNHGYEACIGSPPAALSAPSEPVPDGPRVWASPEPLTIPEDVLAVRDKEGFVWQREPGGVATVGLWWRRSTGAWCDDDRRLVDLCGPLTEVVEESTP